MFLVIKRNSPALNSSLQGRMNVECIHYPPDWTVRLMGNLFTYFSQGSLYITLA